MLEKANIFHPTCNTVSRNFTDNLFWFKVDCPKKVGSDTYNEKEGKTKSVAEQRMYDCLCKNNDEMGDFVDFYIEENLDDDDMASKSSSVYGRDETKICKINSENEPADWENFDHNNVNERIGDSLKHIGNVKNRKRSKLLLLTSLVPRE